jgi:hypothetical protein
LKNITASQKGLKILIAGEIPPGRKKAGPKIKPASQIGFINLAAV